MPPARSLRDQCEDTASKLLGQCQHTDWIVLSGVILGQPLACPGVLMVASGGPTLASALHWLNPHRRFRAWAPHSSSRLFELDHGPRRGGSHPAERYEQQNKFWSSYRRHWFFASLTSPSGQTPPSRLLKKTGSLD